MAVFSIALAVGSIVAAISSYFMISALQTLTHIFTLVGTGLIGLATLQLLVTKETFYGFPMPTALFDGEVARGLAAALITLPVTILSYVMLQAVLVFAGAAIALILAVLVAATILRPTWVLDAASMITG